MKYFFEVDESGAVRLRIQDENGHDLTVVPRAVRLNEACRLFKRSRRHLYRYVRRGWLKPVAKFSGEWFFDLRDLNALEHRDAERRRQAVPRRLAELFPEYDRERLEPDRDADLILARVLERGGSHEIRWALRRYPLSRRKAFLERQGRRLLSARAYRFWTWLWKGKDTPGPAWRKGGLAWGGAA
jgi:hypothetical protein